MQRDILKIRSVLLTWLSSSLLLISFTSLQAQQQMDEIDSKVNQLLSEMTLEEKVGQMTQITLGVLAKGGHADERPEPVELNPAALDSAFNIYKIGSVLNTVNNRARTLEWWKATIDELQERSIKATGIPIIFGIDAIHGNTYTAESTLYPQQIGQGATFNPELIKQLNAITAYEMRASNIPWTFSPVQDMGRDPRDPRFWETYGEDVLLCQTLGAAAVKGIEGEETITDPYHGASCLKHYLAYNSNSGKDRNPLDISVRELKERHAASFQAAIDAGAKTIMVNSGLINGYPVHANYEILTQLLRNEMGFSGMLVTDWADIENLHNRDKVASSHKEAVKLAINAGIDMSMVPYNYRFCEYLIELVQEGEVSMERIDEATARILRLKYELGLFEKPTTDFADYPEFRSEAFEKTATNAALESITLLKNKEGILPLPKSAKVLVTGPNANSMRPLNGGWSYSWQGEKVEEFAQEYHTFLEAIEHKIGKENVSYEEGVSYDMEGKYYEEFSMDLDAVIQAAATVDYVLLFLGENTYCEKPGDLHDLYISDNQTQLAKALAKTGKPVILILNEGRPRIISKFEYLMAGVLQTYLPGNYGGDALAEIIFGDACPSGKLPYTYPMFPNSLITYDYKPSEKQERLEGLYNYESEVAIQYEFGYGLSYTTFEYSNFKVDRKTLSPEKPLQVSIEVKNTGEMMAKEVVMLYTSDRYASISPDNRRLRAFEKIELKPGETKTVSFKVSVQDLAFYNRNNQLVTEAGEFIFEINGHQASLHLEKDQRFDEPSKLKL